MHNTKRQREQPDRRKTTRGVTSTTMGEHECGINRIDLHAVFLFVFVCGAHVPLVYVFVVVGWLSHHLHIILYYTRLHFFVCICVYGIISIAVSHSHILAWAFSLSPLDIHVPAISAATRRYIFLHIKTTRLTNIFTDLHTEGSASRISLSLSSSLGVCFHFLCIFA